MPNEAVQVRSTLGVVQVADIFREVLSGRRVEFGKVEEKDNPFAAVETQPDFSAYASRDKNIGSWAVQIYVYDEGSSRLAEIRAVYHSGLTRAMSGTKNTYSKSAGVKKVQDVIGALQSMDSSMVVV